MLVRRRIGQKRNAFLTFNILGPNMAFSSGRSENNLLNAAMPMTSDAAAAATHERLTSPMASKEKKNRSQTSRFLVDQEAEP